MGGSELHSSLSQLRPPPLPWGPSFLVSRLYPGGEGSREVGAQILPGSLKKASCPPPPPSSLSLWKCVVGCGAFRVMGSQTPGEAPGPPQGWGFSPHPPSAEAASPTAPQCLGGSSGAFWPLLCCLPSTCAPSTFCGLFLFPVRLDHDPSAFRGPTDLVYLPGALGTCPWAGSACVRGGGFSYRGCLICGLEADVSLTACVRQS